jgi:hypothetical protein
MTKQKNRKKEREREVNRNGLNENTRLLYQVKKSSFVPYFKPIQNFCLHLFLQKALSLVVSKLFELFELFKVVSQSFF